MDRRGGVLALGVGLAVSLTVVWAFFATLLPFDLLGIGHPWRGGLPFLVVGLAGFGLGRALPGSGPRTGALVGLPGALLGGGLGVLTALRPVHLLVVAGLVLAYLASASLGGWLGTVAARR